MTFGSQPNIATNPTLYVSTHMQSVAEGATGYRRAITFWKLSEEPWGWQKNSLSKHRGQTSIHILMSIHTKTYSISERAKISIKFYCEV